MAQLTGYLSDVDTEQPEFEIRLDEVTSVEVTARTISGIVINSCVTLLTAAQKWVLATKSEEDARHWCSMIDQNLGKRFVPDLDKAASRVGGVML